MVFVEISGKARSGKSRLLRKIADAMDNEVMIQAWAPITEAALDRMPPDGSLIFDECQPETIKQLKDYAAQSKKRGYIIAAKAA